MASTLLQTEHESEGSTSTVFTSVKIISHQHLLFPGKFKTTNGGELSAGLVLNHEVNRKVGE